jgi:AmiR/NasT family two-component response regulator
MAAVSTIGILNERSSRQHQLLSEQLQTAPNSRVMIEQAKGLVAAHNSGDLAAAFAVIRGTARMNSVLIDEVALSIIEGRTSAEVMARREHGDTSGH